MNVEFKKRRVTDTVQQHGVTVFSPAASRVLGSDLTFSWAFLML